MLIRPAEPADAMAVARVHVRSWQAAYRGIISDDYLARLRPEDRAQKYDFATLDPQKPRTIVAVEDDVIQGFATTLPSCDPETANMGELRALYVDPDQWGRGLGVALLSAARGHLAAMGFEKAVLWVLTGNRRAERFYRKDGWACDGVRRTEIVWDVTVEEIRYQRRLEIS